MIKLKTIIILVTIICMPYLLGLIDNEFNNTKVNTGENSLSIFFKFSNYVRENESKSSIVTIKKHEKKTLDNEILNIYENNLFYSLAKNQEANTEINLKVLNLSENEIKKSSKIIKPVKSATVSAVSWYYPKSYGGGWHPGIDLANIENTDIVAPANGVILASGSHGNIGYGNFLISAHQIDDDTYTFIYGHLKRFAKYDSIINQGDTIAYMGSTGFSTGPHLHLEVFRHRNRTIQDVINEYNANGDYYFGLGYEGIGSCQGVCRLKPNELFNLKINQSF